LVTQAMLVEAVLISIDFYNDPRTTAFKIDDAAGKR